MNSVRTAWARLGVPGKVALAAAFVAALVLAINAPGLVGAFLASRPEAPTGPRGSSGSQDDRYQGYLAQVDGRSLFFVPAAPPPPAPPATAHDDIPRETPKPTRYGGPALIAMVNDTAWFADGTVLKAGGEPSGGIRVLRVNPPWSAAVEWSGVEFDVKLFDRDSVVATEPPPPNPVAPPALSAAPTPPAEPVSRTDPATPPEPREQP
jgi:hypothetical protein